VTFLISLTFKQTAAFSVKAIPWLAGCKFFDPHPASSYPLPPPWQITLTSAPVTRSRFDSRRLCGKKPRTTGDLVQVLWHKRDYPKIQILTTEGLLNGTERVNAPPQNNPFAKSARESVETRTNRNALTTAKNPTASSKFNSPHFLC
jgi:hypothetical protein